MRGIGRREMSVPSAMMGRAAPARRAGTSRRHGTTPARGDWRGSSSGSAPGGRAEPRARTSPDRTNCSRYEAATPTSGRSILRAPASERAPAACGSGKLRRRDRSDAAVAPAGRPGAAAFFDLDKTIIAGSSALAFSRPFLPQGLISRRAALRSAYAQLLLVLSGADADTMDQLRRGSRRSARAGTSRRSTRIVAETLHEIVEPMVYAEATELIAEHRAAGRRGRGAVGVRAGGRRADRGDGRCRPLRGDPDGVGGRPLHRRDRLLLLRRGEGDAPPRRSPRSAATGLADCHAYTDSITDLPLLEAVGHPVVVNPDRGAAPGGRGAGLADPRRSARRSPLRSRLRPRSCPAVPALGGVAVLAALGGRRLALGAGVTVRAIG